MSRNIVILGILIIAAVVLVGLFAPLSIYTSGGTCSEDRSKTQLTVKLHMIKGQTISHQKDLDSTAAPTGEGCHLATKYVQYFF